MGTELISRLAGVGVTGLLVCSAAHADLTVGVEAGAGYTDNIRRVDQGAVDEKIAVVGLDLDWVERTRRIDGNAQVDLSYNEYLDDTFDGEVLGTANASVTLGIVPERFTWLVQDSFGQAQSDPFAPVTPETRENLNYFTTGPDLLLRLGSAANLRVFGRYSLTQYENSPLDSTQKGGGGGIFRELSPRSTVGVNVVSERIEFDDNPASDYDRQGAFLSYNIDGGRTDINAELGYSRLKPENGDDDGGLFASLTVQRRMTAASTLRFEAGRQFTDSGESLRNAVVGSSVGGVNVTASSDPFQNTSAGLSWTFARHRTGLTLGASWEEDRYERQTQFDRNRITYAASFTRRLSQVLDLTLSASLDDENFNSAGLDSEEMFLRADLSWQLGRRFGLALSVDRSDRSTSSGLGEFTENRVFLMLTYRPRTAPELGSTRR